MTSSFTNVAYDSDYKKKGTHFSTKYVIYTNSERPISEKKIY